MTTVIVTKNFNQIVGDKIVFDCALFCEVETENPEHYASFLFNVNGVNSNTVYDEKMKFCLTSRIEEYAKLNQFEMQYNDQINGTTTWVDTISLIKEKYPKPTK